MKKFIGFFLIAGLIILHSCSDKPDDIKAFKPTVTNLQYSELSFSSVTLSAEVSDDGGSFVIKRGFRLSKSKTDTPAGNWGTGYSCGDGFGGFSKTIEGLEENTTYYYSAYASNTIGDSFTTVSSFITPKKKNSGIEGTPVVLNKPTLNSMEYSATGFENSNGDKFSYKMIFTVEIAVNDYINISRVGYKIGGQAWYWENPTGNDTYSYPMSMMGNSSTLSTTITAYALMKDGTEYTGNSETISATYNGNTNGGTGGSTISNKYAETTEARTEYSGGHATFVAYETMVSHLNRYGLLIYKDGNSYYWKDFDGKKHSAMPNIYYTNKVYASDTQMGNSLNNYQVKKAYIYVDFMFKPF